MPTTNPNTPRKMPIAARTASVDIYRGDEHPLLDVQADLLDGLDTRIVVPVKEDRGSSKTGQVFQ